MCLRSQGRRVVWCWGRCVLLRVFEYGATELTHLSQDTQLAKVIAHVGQVERMVNDDVFTALLRMIIGQQISAKAERTIWQRLQELTDDLSPQFIAQSDPDTLQAIGISYRKVGYLQGVAQAVLSGEIDLNALSILDDEAVCRQLIRLKGVGLWTAQMFLIFSLGRKDVLSFGDLAILRGLRMLYGHDVITPELFADYQKRFSPYGTVASFYLWEVASGHTPYLTDPAKL